MKGCLGFSIFIIILGIMICFVEWMFSTDFILFDILLVLCLIALAIITVLSIIILIIWIIGEFF